MDGERESGFTLIELLIAIVVAGILTAVAIVGIAGLTDSGSKSACKSSMDAAKAATAVFYANSASEDFDGHAYPQSLGDLTQKSANNPRPLMEFPGDKQPAVGDMTFTVNGWTLEMTKGATVDDAPTYTCK